MDVYIAAPYELRAEVKILARMLRWGGINCAPRWLDTNGEEEKQFGIKIDLEDIANCKVLVAFNPTGWRYKGSGGRHFELGMAYALGKKLLLLGEKTNIFHSIESIIYLDPSQYNSETLPEIFVQEVKKLLES